MVEDFSSNRISTKRTKLRIISALLLAFVLITSFRILPLSAQEFEPLWAYEIASYNIAANNDGSLVCIQGGGFFSPIYNLIFIDSNGQVMWNVSTSGVNYVKIREDGGRILTTGSGGPRIFDPLTGRIIQELTEGANYWAVTPDFNYLVGVDYVDDLLFKINANTLEYYYVAPFPDSIQPNLIKISDDGESIVLREGYSSLYGIDGNSGQLIWEYSMEEEQFWVGDFDLSADGTLIGFGLPNGKVYLLDENGSQLWTYQTTSQVSQVRISKDNKYVAVGTGLFEGIGPANYEVKLFDVNGTLLWTYSAQGNVRAIEISPSCEYVVAGSYDNNIYFLDIHTGELIDSYKTGQMVGYLSVSPNSKFIAASVTSAIFVFPRPNISPIASFGSSHETQVAGEPIEFDASDSSDPDGAIVNYAWNFGDGNTGTGMGTAHSYSLSGTYTVTLTVTDNDGKIGTTTKSITVIPPPEPPVASFTSSPSSPEVGQTVAFDASGSSDPDGTITTYSWNFGDGATATGITTTHSYSSAGTYTVTLTVTDNDELTGTTTKTITVAPHEIEPQAPSASFTSSPSSPEVGQTVAFDASGSSDPDGTITNYAWDFGDGKTTTGATSSHSYSSSGTYTVTLTVTDNDGLTGTTTKSITVPPSGNGDGVDNEPPLANAGSDRTVDLGSVVPFSAASSSDNVGIVSYEWDFGDGTTGTGVAPKHTYEAEGDYIVTLTVRDAAGNFHTVTILVTVKEAAAGGFPFWILIPIIIAVIVAVVLLWFFFLKKREPKEKVSKPTKIRITVDPSELIADGKSKSSIIIELLDKEGNPVSALSDTEIKLNSTMGQIEEPLTKIPKGKDKAKSVLVSPRSAGEVTLSADAKGLKGTSITVSFMEKKRYCMHCGAKMAYLAKKCSECGRSPPGGVDTKRCRNCKAVIPIVANFCAECGAAQPDQESS